MTIRDGALKLTESVKSAQELVSVISRQLEKEGKSVEQYDLAKACEVKSAMKMETKANEVEHSTNTGYGAELVPQAVQTVDFLDLVPKYGTFIQALRGYHGRNLNKIQEVPVIGEIGLHQLSSEWTTGSPTSMIAQGKGLLPTAKVTLTQKKYLFSVDISDEEMRFVNVVDIVAKVNEKLARSAARTQEALVVNGDPETGGTGNVNSDDGAPSATSYYLGATGLRRTAIAASDTVDVGTLEFADFLSSLQLLGDFASAPEDLVWIFNRATYIKALGVTEFKDFSQNGRFSTIVGGLTNFLGSDVFVSREMPKTEADGKVSTTPGNNTLGQFLVAHRDSVQYGYNGDYNLEIFRVPGFGWQVLGFYFMGMGIASEIAGNTGHPTVALGRNITL